jgi:hypothetical protein
MRILEYSTFLILIEAQNYYLRFIEVLSNEIISSFIKLLKNIMEKGFHNAKRNILVY